MKSIMFIHKCYDMFYGYFALPICFTAFCISYCSMFWKCIKRKIKYSVLTYYLVFNLNEASVQAGHSVICTAYSLKREKAELYLIKFNFFIGIWIFLFQIVILSAFKSLWNLFLIFFKNLLIVYTPYLSSLEFNFFQQNRQKPSEKCTTKLIS